MRARVLISQVEADYLASAAPRAMRRVLRQPLPSGFAPEPFTLDGGPVRGSGHGVIRRLQTVGEEQVAALSELLIDCIDGGAGVSFLHPLTPAKAQAFWREVAGAVARGERALLVAEDDSGIVGTVQLVLHQPENQPHRADVSKMLVHRRARRRGLGAALLRCAETTARASAKTLLVLDTNEGSDAERLYARLGWIRVGTIPDYSVQPRGGLRGATIFYKKLEGGRTCTTGT